MIQFAGNAAVGGERLQLAPEHAAVGPPGGLGEESRAARERVVEGLLSQPVAGEGELLVARVPERDGEDAVQLFDESLAPFEVRAEHHFGIAAGREGVTAPPQARADLVVLVGLAIEEQRHSVGRHRLHAAFDVEDGEPAVPQGGRSLDEEPVCVGAAVREGGGHPPHRLCIRRSREVDVSADAAHRSSPSSRAASGRRARARSIPRRRDRGACSATRNRCAPSSRRAGP